MNESGSKGHKPLFSQTFFGAVIVVVVGGILVWVVTNSLLRRSPPIPPVPTISSESISDRTPNVGSIAEVRDDETSARGSELTEGEDPADREPTQDFQSEPRSRRQTKQGFEFVLEKCAAEGEDINCSFLVTNKLGRPKLSIFRDGSWLNDQDHNRHKAWRILESDGSMEFNILQIKLPNDSPERFGLHFKGITNSVTAIRFLNLHIMGDDLGWRDVEVE